MATTKGTLRGAAATGRTPPGTPSIKERWQAARDSGDKMFEPGVACVNGHDSPRWTNNGICIECKRARDNAYNAAHKLEHRARSKRSADARPEQIKAYRKAYHRAHAQTANQRAREWQIANREASNAIKRLSYWRNRATRLRRMAELRAANPTPARMANKRWKHANRHLVRAADSLRRARQAGATAGCRKAYAAYLRWAQTVRSAPCYWCHKSTKPGQRHVDHIIPIAKGGADTVANLCVACPPCNLRKNAKMPEDFAGQSELAFA